MARAVVGVLAAICVAATLASAGSPATTDSTAAPQAPARPQGMPDAPGSRPDAARSDQRFDDVEHWRRVWDDPERIGWQEPQRVVDWLRLQPGMRVAEIGAGTGFFLPYLSRAAGARGTVYAIDIEPGLVEYMQERAQRDSLPNVVPRLATPDDPGLADLTDRVLLVDTYHHIDNRVAYFERLRKWLDASSMVMVVDWKPGELSRGPAPSHKISPDEVVDEMRRAGYRSVERHDLQYQYVLLFRPEIEPSGR